MLTVRSALFAHWSLKAVTPMVLEEEEALVVGIPYMDCKQAGVIFLLQLVARDVILECSNSDSTILLDALTGR